MKKFLVCILTLVFAFGLCACGSTDESAEEILTKAQESLKDVKSMSYDVAMEMEMEMAAAGQTIPMNMTMSADYINDPMQMKADVIMDMGEMGTTAMNMYVVDENGAYVSYMGADSGDGTIGWVKQTVADMDELGLDQYDVGTSMQFYLNCIQQFTAGAEEEIHGTAAVRYDGVITNEYFNQILEQTGVLEQFAQMDLSGIDMADMFSDMGDLPISVWIAKESYVPVKYEADMTAMMQNLMSKIMDSVEGAEAFPVEINRMFVSTELYNINGIDSIVIPQEALNAAELSQDVGGGAASQITPDAAA